MHVLVFIPVITLNILYYILVCKFTRLAQTLTIEVKYGFILSVITSLKRTIAF